MRTSAPGSTTSTGACLRLDRVNQWVLRGETIIQLTPKAFAVLRYLAERAGQLVGKQELLDVIWRDTVVGEAVLATAVREVRKELGDDASQPRLIETVHRRGYRWIGVLALDGPAAPAPAPASAVSATPQARRPVTAVGRDAELARLHAAWTSALAGERRVVFISADAGIGKTALADAFLGDDQALAGAWIGRGQCIEQLGVSEAYLPILAALGELCRGPDGAALVALLRTHAPGWLWQMPLFRDALNPEERQALSLPISSATPERMLREMTEALEAAAAERPLVLLLEDLHWSDTATLDLLAFLARRRGAARVLVLCTYRPTEVILRGHPLRAVKHELQLQGRCEDLPLGTLDERAVGDLLLARFGNNAPEAPLRSLARALHGRTDGIALFVVAVINDLVERGEIGREADGRWIVHRHAEAAIEQVPASLREMIERQLDRLPPDHLQLIEAAAVAGVEFSAAAVAAAMEIEVDAAETRCEALARRERLLLPRGSAEWPDKTFASRYGFVHAIHRDVAYQRIPAGLRARMHLRIAERLKSAFRMRAVDIASELALHFEAGRDADKAVKQFQQAADNALKRAGAAEAARSLQRGLALLETLPETAARDARELSLQIGLGTALTLTEGYVAPAVERAFDRATEICGRVEGASLMLPLGGLYRYAVVRGEHRRGLELAERMLQLVEQAKDPTLHMFARGMMGISGFWLGDIASSRLHLEHSQSLYNFDVHRFIAFAYGDDPQVASFALLAFDDWLQGRPDAALANSLASIAMAERLDHPTVLALAHFLASQLRRMRRDYADSEALASAAHAQAREHGIRLIASVSGLHVGWARAQQGFVKEGLVQVRSCLDDYVEIGAESGLPQYYAALAEVLALAGQPGPGLEALDQGLAVLARTEERWWEAELHRLRGELVLGASNDRETAQAHFERALDTARQLDLRGLELRAATSLARLWRGAGRDADARGLLASVHSAFTEGADTPDLRDAAALLAQL